MADEKHAMEKSMPHSPARTVSKEYAVGDSEAIVYGDDEDGEVFKKNTDGVDFRTVGWVRASVIFLKSEFPIPRPLMPHSPIPQLEPEN
jgi:hypothetical protein